MMKKVYGDDCLSRSRIHERFKRFQEGREALEDDERPRYVLNEKNAEIVRAEIIAEIYEIRIRNIRIVDLSYFKTTLKRPQYSLTKNRIVTTNHSP